MRCVVMGPVSPEEYLAFADAAPGKHEYADGYVHRRADPTNGHNHTTGNVTAALHLRARGRGWWAINSATRIRIRTPGRVRFYHPDSGVTCRPNPGVDWYEDHPAILAEVVEPATRHLDEGEKRDAYLSIHSLAVYLLIEQDRPFVVAYRRSETGFVREEYDGMDAVIPLPVIGSTLPFAENYDEVEFAQELEPR